MIALLIVAALLLLVACVLLMAALHVVARQRDELVSANERVRLGRSLSRHLID